MLLMAIDHAHYFLSPNQYVGGEFWQGEFPVHNDVGLFLIRYLTHLCAPGFVFLMGVSMTFFYQNRLSRGWSHQRCLKYYFKRASVIIMLQFFYENLCWQINSNFKLFPIYFGVLALFGALIMICALCMQLSSRLLVLMAILCESIIIWTAQQAVGQDSFSTLFYVLLMPGETPFIDVYYSIFPWIPLAFMGVIFGRKILKYGDKFMKKLPQYTLQLILLTVLIRFFSKQYGNLRSIAVTDILSFFYGTKYPPSPFYLAWTMSCLFLCIYLFYLVTNSRWNKFLKPISILGKSPLFFYLIHLLTFALLGSVGLGLGERTLLGWGLGLLIVFPLTVGYQRLKMRYPEESLLRML